MFYRTAYRITEYIGQNVIKPLIADGNPLPSMKYLGWGAVAGATLMQSNYLFLHRETNKYHDIPRSVLDAMSKAETLAVFGAFTDEQYGNFSDRMFMVRMLKNAYQELNWVINDSKKPFDASVDWSRSNIPLFNDIVTVWENNAKPEFAEVKRFRKMQNYWANVLKMNEKDRG